MMGGSEELCSDESQYNTSCMVMHRSSAFEDLMRNAIMNASLQRSMEEDVSGCGEHFQLLLVSFTSQLCFGAQENIAEWLASHN